MQFVKSKIPLLALTAAFVGAMVVFGSTFTPTQRFGVLMLALLAAALVGDLIFTITGQGVDEGHVNVPAPASSVRSRPTPTVLPVTSPMISGSIVGNSSNPVSSSTATRNA